MLVVAAITCGTLRLAERMVSVIGLHGMNARSKVMGFLILCAGMHFVGNGLPGIATDPAMLSTIRDDVKN